MTILSQKKLSLKSFDRSSFLAGDLHVVWLGDKCGIFNSSTEALVLEIEFNEIAWLHLPFCSVLKGEKRGNFDVFTYKLGWIT